MAASMDAFENYFKRADLNQDGKISGSEAVAFFQGSNLPQQVLATIWTFADQNKAGFLGRNEFFNALRLVTVAQSGRALTPDIVNAALYGPAAAKIPPPKINPVPSPTTQMNPVPTPVPARGNPQMGSLNQAQYPGVGTPQVVAPGISPNQQLFPSGQNLMRPPQAVVPSPTPLQAPAVNQGLAGTGTAAGPRALASGAMDLSIDWLGNKTTGASQVAPRGTTAPPSQNITDGLGLSSLSTTINMSAPRPQAQTAPLSSVPARPQDSALSSLGLQGPDSKALVMSQNGLSSSSPGFGNDLFSVNSQAKTSASATSSGQISFAQLDPLRSTQGGNPVLPPTQPTVKPQQLDKAPNVSAGLSSLATTGQSQPPWPKITQSDIQKYTKVFQEVDKDRDGRITGVEARNLFLSWKLPRDVLKQVWDLSDQDNDGMLSLREFCIALYLMERHRQGTVLPKSLPDSLMYDEKLLQATGLPSSAYMGPTWQQSPGMANRGIPGAVAVPGMGVMRPPHPGHMHPHMKAGQQAKLNIPGMDNNHAVNQVNRDGQGPSQSAVGAESQVAAGADKKAPEMEKHILDSKEKLEFYRTKMQELVLYKSRCDNRLNEITERASSDKREVESLAKKYEEKYKQVGEIASKLAIEEATIRDVHERKMELHNAIIKMEQGGSADGLLQVRADRIQYQLEELEKALAERCKQFGLNVKPAASIELPSGWEPGTQEGAVEWDEDWDKFEDEGFMVVKANTTKVEHVAPTENNNKTGSTWNGDGYEFSPVASSSNGYFKGESNYVHSEEDSGRSPSSSPAQSTLESPFMSSPHTKDNFSDHAESSIFGDKYADEPSWNFDDTDTDSVWGVSIRDGDHQRGPQDSFFSSGGFGVDSPTAASIYGKKKTSFFDDSVPNSPSFSTSGFSPKFNQDSSFNYGRFDSFKTEDSGFFPPQDNNNHFSRFDSISSSKGEGISRFDSMKSSADFGHNRSRFDSFDEADPFGSTGPFKASGSHSPPRF